ncbi:aldehyde dehydrogenase family protein [Winogradskyella maritima]|uniref:Aldehyde dehydrogenase n=1 Tax=Winogradskyella maritima TaxID=1517766 RepID=A0ABV8AE47_9FLAO|nr:aldehyde dehydrogenase family protein [Winogradskyella maritima]
MTETTVNPYQYLFNAQKARSWAIARTSYKERLKKLDKLQSALQKTYKTAIRQAIYDDFKKPIPETDVSEIYLVLKEIKHAKLMLRRWMAKHRVETPIALIGTSSYYKYEPKGVCLIISPWNYPFNLTFSPLVGAIAAGNAAIIKPSEMTPNVSSLIAKIVSDLFNEDEVAVVEGEVEASTHLLKLPFNHIFFTGSPAVGKIVMKAASAHLASVTLELGGKSPVIVDGTSSVKTAARNVLWIKGYNNGQTCIAPDYVLIHEEVKDEFVKHFKYYCDKFYGEDPEKSNSYSRVVNLKHFNRLKEYLKDAKHKGGTFEVGGEEVHEEECYIEPTLISNLPEDALLWKEEIFGPILPIRTYKDLDEAIDYVNSKEKPLALYIYSNSKSTIDKIMTETRAGTTGIRNNGIQYTNHHLPFGGVNNSGIGKAHGFETFKAFSNQRSVIVRHSPGLISLLKPPYTPFVQKLVDITLKWL